MDNAGSARPLKVVAIGGGNGLSTLLHGLKNYAVKTPSGLPTLDITAVVTVTDDGGSSGRLRRELDMLPPGDIRNCMVALSEDEALLSKLFQYRFSSGRGLKGHSFGNLFLTALTYVMGDFAQAVKASSEILASYGRIFPSTAANVGIEAVLDDGTRVIGESLISKTSSRIKRICLNPRRCQPLPETLEALAEADLICMGPGSLFTSVIPNLLVSGIPRAIDESPAVKAYFVNLMWQPGETTNFTATDHVQAIHQHARRPLLDYAIVNTRPIASMLRRRYAVKRAMPVENDLHRLEKRGLQVIEADLLADSSMVRHNSDAVAAIAMDLARLGAERRRVRLADRATS